MGVDHEPGGAFDGLGHGGQVTVADVGGAAARRADDVVVVIRPAGDVSVLAVGEVDALDGVELDEDVESPEYRGAADAQPSPARIGGQVGGAEGTLARGEGVGRG